MYHSYTESNTSGFVTPGNMVWSPMSPKAWCNFNGVNGGTIKTGFNANNVVRAGTGDYTVVFGAFWAGQGCPVVLAARFGYWAARM